MLGDGDGGGAIGEDAEVGGEVLGGDGVGHGVVVVAGVPEGGVWEFEGGNIDVHGAFRAFCRAGLGE